MSNSSPSVTTLNKPQEKTSQLQSWLVVLSAALFFFYIFIQLNIFNAISPALLKQFSISATRLGSISAHYFYANLIFLFPAGILLDRFSVRKVLLSAMGLAILGTLAFSFATSVGQMELARFLIGAVSVFNVISCVKLASRWFPPQRMALVMGVAVTMAMFGGMIAQTPLTMLTDYLNWRTMLRLDGGFGIALLGLMLVFVRDWPKHSELEINNQQQFLNNLSLKKRILLTISNRQNWLGGLYANMMNLPIFLLGAIWGSLYLTQIHNLSRTQASLVVSMLFIGTMIGSPVIGWISDTICRRRKPMLICNAISLIFMLILIYTPHLNLFLLMVIFFALGFFTSAQVIGYPLITESNSLNLTGSAIGFAAVLLMSGGLLQPVFGFLMELNWNHQLLNGVPIYSLHDFRLALLIIPIAFVFSFIMAIMAKETYCKSLYEEENHD